MSVGRRPISNRDRRPDGSAWREDIEWHDASGCAPVFGHPILIQTQDGNVHVLDLRAGEGYRWDGDDRVKCDREFEHTRAALKRHGAKWWAYIPIGPPVNVYPVPWSFDEHGNPVVPTCSDPPKEEMQNRRHQSHEILEERFTCHEHER